MNRDERQLVRREIGGWGTVITIDVPAADDERPGVGAALDGLLPAVVDLVRRIDQVFSAHRPDSWTSALRERRPPPAEVVAMAWTAQVVDGCALAERISRGAFSPRRAPHGFDPSGYVKGWGAGMIADLVVDAGLDDVCVNAAGDLAVRGYGPVGAWRVGIVHPHRVDALCAVVEAAPPGEPGAVATSGFSQQAAHIVGRGQPPRAICASQATVAGPDAGLADALATALLVDGVGGSPWFADYLASQSDPDWGAMVIEDDQVWWLGRFARPDGSASPGLG